ncbi:helix-turn-helix domain-containing protein [Nioella sp. MMSF_3534]|uniref:winged helix-turn-helix transcriptional regulator n=1 Tax=Nioella sp. MMSF_3534 TaxID=3046720 RepID=UPI00273E8787|nr:helix-turn-helix domain-containing protein [Nioella sp. MMSF_3534]
MASILPRPGQPVRGSKSGKPIMALFDLLGRTWALGAIWQLSRGAMTFRELQAACEGVSPTVLNRRLKELTASGLVERAERGYRLSDAGRDLFGLLHPLGGWSETWAARMAEQDAGQPRPGGQGETA